MLVIIIHSVRHNNIVYAQQQEGDDFVYWTAGRVISVVVEIVLVLYLFRFITIAIIFA